MTSDVEQSPMPHRSPRESLDEQARRKGAKPFMAADDLRDDEVWESEEELAEFLRYFESTRQAGCV